MFKSYRNRWITENGHISNHTRRINDLHWWMWHFGWLKFLRLIKVCNNSPFRRTCFVTSLTKQCYVLFEITFFVFFFHWATFVVHFSGSLMEANRSNKQFTKYDYWIRCSHALSVLSHNARQTTSGRKVYFFHFKVLKFITSLFSGDHMS